MDLWGSDRGFSWVYGGRIGIFMGLWESGRVLVGLWGSDRGF